MVSVQFNDAQAVALRERLGAGDDDEVTAVQILQALAQAPETEGDGEMSLAGRDLLKDAAYRVPGGQPEF